MAVEGIHTQIPRETPLQPKLDNPEIIEKLRHGNIYEVLRTQVSAEDFNKFINFRGRLFENEILQNYQVYADHGSIPPPDFSESNFPRHDVAMSLSSEDRHFFHQEMEHYQARAMSVGGAKHVETPQGPGQDVSAIAEGALQDWNEFFGDLQMRVMDAQMVQQMKQKGEELNKEIQRMVALVMSGQADPEYVLIAAAKSHMAQSGIMFATEGKKIMHINEQMNGYSKALYTMDANDPRYFKELQMSQSKTRDASSNMQVHMMNIQQLAQGIAGTLEFASNAARTFYQGRQSQIQAIGVR